MFGLVVQPNFLFGAKLFQTHVAVKGMSTQQEGIDDIVQVPMICLMHKPHGCGIERLIANIANVEFMSAIQMGVESFLVRKLYFAFLTLGIVAGHHEFRLLFTMSFEIPLFCGFGYMNGPVLDQLVHAVETFTATLALEARSFVLAGTFGD